MRLFTFGCSFTQYKWPTWADILGKEFEFFENWGAAGAGNVYISNTVVQANIKHSFTKDDTVIIMWTNMMREDRYLHSGWVGPGNIYTQETYDDDFVKKYVTIRGCYVRDMAQIYLIEQLLEKIGCKYHFLSMVDVNNPMQYTTNEQYDEIDDILIFYKSTIDKFKPSVHKTMYKYNWKSLSGIKNDTHPLPFYHFLYLRKVLPEYHISDETITWVTKIDEDTRTGTITGWDSSLHVPKEKL